MSGRKTKMVWDGKWKLFGQLQIKNVSVGLIKITRKVRNTCAVRA